MFEKVNPAHPDKLADRIAGALVDLAYTQEENPRVAVPQLIELWGLNMKREVASRKNSRTPKEK